MKTAPAKDIDEYLASVPAKERTQENQVPGFLIRGRRNS